MRIFKSKSRFLCQVIQHSSIYQDAATATMIITMRSHQTNHCEDICDDDHMLLTAPAALDAANYTMFVTHPFSVMTHNSNQKYVDVYLSSIFSIVLVSKPNCSN